jgi:hypothetical protein
LIIKKINNEWQEEVIDKQSGNTYPLAMMAPTIASTLLSGNTSNSSYAPVVDGGLVHFAKHAKLMGISKDPAGYVQRTRRASTI